MRSTRESTWWLNRNKKLTTQPSCRISLCCPTFFWVNVNFNYPNPDDFFVLFSGINVGGGLFEVEVTSTARRDVRSDGFRVVLWSCFFFFFLRAPRDGRVCFRAFFDLREKRATAPPLLACHAKSPRPENRRLDLADPPRPPRPPRPVKTGPAVAGSLFRERCRFSSLLDAMLDAEPRTFGSYPLPSGRRRRRISLNQIGRSRAPGSPKKEKKISESKPFPLPTSSPRRSRKVRRTCSEKSNIQFGRVSNENRPVECRFCGLLPFGVSLGINYPGGTLTTSEKLRLFDFI